MPNHPFLTSKFQMTWNRSMFNFCPHPLTGSRVCARFLTFTARGGQPSVDSRLIMSPTAASCSWGAFAENIKRYETKFGEIKMPGTHTLAV